MQFYKSLGDAIQCELCIHQCRLKEGAIGRCQVNQNREGELHTLVYGKPSALQIDPIEKKPLYHFLPGTQTFSLGTVGCNLVCPFCQNHSLCLSAVPSSSGGVMSPDAVVREALRREVTSISFTYNEPTIFWPYARDIANAAEMAGLKRVMVTNGCMSSKVAEDMIGKIDAVNIDVKSGSPDVYKRLLKGSLHQVLQNLSRLYEGGVWVELTSLIVPGVATNKREFRELAKDVAGRLPLETPWHISAFHPAHKYMHKAPTTMEELETAVAILEKVGFKHIYIGNRVGRSNTYCASCNSLLIGRDGYNTQSFYRESGLCPDCQTQLMGVFQ